MASNKLPAVLAVEILAGWPTTTAGGTAPVDRGHDCGESHVGRGTDCLGTAGEARDSGLATYGAAIHVGRSRTHERFTLAGLEFFRAQSRTSGARVRFLRHGDGDVPRAL